MVRVFRNMVVDEVFTNSAEFGIISQRDYFDKDIANSENIDGYYIVEPNDFVYNPRISTLAPFGPVRRNKLDKSGAMSPLYYVFRTHDVDCGYLEYFFKTNRWHSFMHLNGNSGARSDRFAIRDEVFRDMPISMPQDIAEQKKVGDFFSTLELAITLHQREYFSFDFGGGSAKNVQKTLSWEQRKLSDLIEENQKPVPKPDGEYIRLGIRSHAKGTFHEVVAEGEGLDVDTMYVVEANNLIVNITFAWEEAWAITTEKDAEKLVSHRFPQYRFHQGQYPMFYQYRFRNGRMKYNLELASPGGAGRNRVLNKTEFMKIPVIIPTSYEEEKKIGDLFTNLDNLITLHQREYFLFDFSGESAKTDQNTLSWEQRKVGEWGNFYYGHSCPKWSVTEDATTPCIRYGEMYTKFGCKIDIVYSYTNIPKENLKFSKGTEVLVPRVGEDPMDYNHCTWLSLANVAIGEMISVYNTEQNPLFTAIMFNATLKYEFAKRVEGGSVTNLYYEKLLEIPVSFPVIEEQKKIASFF